MEKKMPTIGNECKLNKPYVHLIKSNVGGIDYYHAYIIVKVAPGFQIAGDAVWNPALETYYGAGYNPADVQGETNCDNIVLELSAGGAGGTFCYSVTQIEKAAGVDKIDIHVIDPALVDVKDKRRGKTILLYDKYDKRLIGD